MYRSPLRIDFHMQCYFIIISNFIIPNQTRYLYTVQQSVLSRYFPPYYILFLTKLESTPINICDIYLYSIKNSQPKSCDGVICF